MTIEGLALPVDASIETGDSGELDAPKRRVVNVATAHSILKRLEPEQNKRIETFRAVKDQADGGQPFSQKELDKHGLSHISNTSWRDTEALIETYIDIYAALAWHGVDYPINFQVEIGPERYWSEFSQILKEEMKSLTDHWFGYYKEMILNLKDMVTYGFGALIWPDEGCFYFQHQDMWRVIVPPREKNDIDSMSFIMIPFEMKAQKLWETYEEAVKSEDGTFAGWDAKAIDSVLSNFYQKQLSTRASSFSTESQAMSLQQAVKNNDISYAHFAIDEVPLIMFLVKEWSGKISKLIFARNILTGEFLYEMPEQFEKMSDVIFIFPMLAGEPELHANKGMGQRTFSCFESLTRIDNAIMDAAMRLGTTFVRTRTGRNRDPRQFRWVHNGVVDIGEAEFVQNFMQGNLQPMFEAQRTFRMKLYQNNNYSDMDSSEGGNKKTLGEVQAQVTQGARIQKNRAEHFYKYLDWFVRIFTRKILTVKRGSEGYYLVERFKGRCVARGVPQELLSMKTATESNFGLPEGLMVFAERANASGNQIADLQETGMIMSMINLLPPSGRIEALKDRIRAIRGSRGGFIDRYLPAEELPQKSFPEDSIIMLENDAMVNGGQTTVADSNDDVAHLTGHLKFFIQYAQQVMQDPSQLQQADGVLNQRAGPHIAQHLAKLSQDPTETEKFKEFQVAANQLANMAKQIQANAQAQQQAQQAAQQKQQEQMAQAQAMNGANDPKMTKVMKDNERKTVEMGMKERRAGMQLALDEQRKNAAAEADLARKAEEASHQQKIDIIKVNSGASK